MNYDPENRPPTVSEPVTFDVTIRLQSHYDSAEWMGTYFEELVRTHPTMCLPVETVQAVEVSRDIPGAAAVESQGDGGDISLRPGIGYTSADPIPDGVDGRICFYPADDYKTPMLALSSDGEITVRGEVVDDNPAVYRAFRAWMADANITLNTGGKSSDGGSDGGDATVTDNDGNAIVASGDGGGADSQ